MKGKKIITWVFLIFVFGALCSYVFAGSNEYYEKYEKYKYGFFPYYSTIKTNMSFEDEKETWAIVNEIENAFKYTGTDPDSLGELGYFSKENHKKGVERVEVDIDVITASFSFGRGYMWFEYSDKRYGEDDEVISSSGNCLCYLKLESEDNFIWNVTKIKETA